MFGGLNLVSFDLVALPCKTLHLLHFNISRDAFQLPFWPSLVLFGVGSQSPTDSLLQCTENLPPLSC